MTVDDVDVPTVPPRSPRPLDEALIAAVAPLLKERVARLDEIAPLVGFLFGFEAPEYEASLLAEKVGGDMSDALRVLDAGLHALDAVPADGWSKDAVEAGIRSMEEALGAKLRKFVSVLYVATMGRAQGIPLFDSLVLLGRERTLQRLRTARAMAEHAH